MTTRFRLLALTLSGLLLAAERSGAEESSPDLKPLLKEVKTLVEKYYPKATVTLNEGVIHFEFHTRKYMIHEPLLTGEWQDAHEEWGPQKGGVSGDIELRAGTYGGQAVVPQAFNKHYFTNLLLAPYSKKLDYHAYVHLKYPSDASKDFVKEFHKLIDDFDQYATAGK